jgi:hypothetical protein
VDHDDDDPAALTLRHNLAIGWRLRGDLQRAATTYERLVDDMTRVFGPEHPSTLATAFNLADCCAGSGASGRAVELYGGLLAVYRRTIGEDQINTLKVRRCLIEQGAGAGGESYEDLRVDLRRLLGAAHPETLAVRRAVASRRPETGELEVLLGDHLQTLGPRHADTMSVREHLASALGKAGRGLAAVAEFERLLADQLEVLGPDDPETLKTRHSVLLWHGGPGSDCQRPELLALLDDQTRVLGRDHPYALVTRGSLGLCHLQDGEPAAAAAIFEDLLADELRVLGPDDPQTVGTRHNLVVARG